MAVNRLSRGALRSVPVASRPVLTPGAAGPGIVHFGLSAFHRAHQAMYTEEAMAAKGGDWGIVAVAPRSRDVLDAILAQDLLFSVTSLGAGVADTRVVGALVDARHAASDPLSVVGLIADPRIRVVTLTVTEKAYALEPADGRLRLDDGLRADLTGARPPQSVPGLLVCGLLARERAGAGPLAVVSCDNLPANGERVRSMVFQALAAAGADPSWVAANVTFPGTTVDRIVPATTAETLATAEQALGVTDLAAVAAEPFRQWVIEDDFPSGRPAWEAAGAILTEDAGPYERLKLRVLNGVHSSLAYLGALDGCETIAEALARPYLRRFAERLVAEDILPTLDPPAGVDPVQYGQTVLERFANPAIRHRTLQIAMDGSQKLPQRLLHTIADARRAGRLPAHATLAVAAWMRFVAGTGDDGRTLPLDDPLADEIRAALAGGVDGLLGLRAVFPAEFAEDAELRSAVVSWHGALGHGVPATLDGAA
jgi:fructuronate reductase